MRGGHRALGNRTMGNLSLSALPKEQKGSLSQVIENDESDVRYSCKEVCAGRSIKAFEPALRILSLARSYFGMAYAVKPISNLSTAQLLVAFLLAVPFNTMAQDSVSKGVPRGRFLLRLAAPPDSGFCKDFTANLNQFRHLDFDTCDRRLSPKYPQLVRPAWEQIPWDMDIAKKIIKAPYSDIGWERWLKLTEAARASGEVKLWRLNADLLSNGQMETLVRLNHVWIGEHPHPYCSYIDSRQIVLNAPSTDFGNIFSSIVIGNGLGSDLIYDSHVNHFYLLNWNTIGSSQGHGEDFYLGRGMGLKRIGATASVMAYSVDVHGIAPACWIDWVPAKHH